PDQEIVFPCSESAAVFRIMIAVAGAKGLTARFLREGRLPERPFQPYRGELESHGMIIREERTDVLVSGKLTPGRYTLPGNISSQFVTGLAMALPLLEKESLIFVRFPIESRPYIRMTLRTVFSAGLHLSEELPDDGIILVARTGYSYQLPPRVRVEKDWSSSAAFLMAGAVSSKGIIVTGLSKESLQGDRKIIGILKEMGAEVNVEDGAVTVKKGVLKGIEADFKDMPDILPMAAVLASAAEGESVLKGASRLRMKESDRLKGTADLLHSLGADVTETEDGLVIRGGKPLSGGIVSVYSDHRLVMAAALAACLSESPVMIDDADAADKSFPGFFEEWERLERIS
ncbi:MAG: 3-phosphoshikimate 1-carboxyvinyltransferase, partial [Lachnospiraceae bacterium]|nr:3-phosphoshikimate 1-carboxyvinyltransferase [Lachnospiraceae bacterium]